MESAKELKKFINLDLGGSLVRESLVGQEGHHLLFHVGHGIGNRHVLECEISLVVLLQHLEDVRLLEDGGNLFVFARKAQSHQSIPLQKVDGRRRIVRHNAHHRRLDFGRWSKVVLSHLDDVRDLGKELCIYRKTTIEFISGCGNETHRKLSLKHQEGMSKHRTVRQEFERETRRDLVGRVGNTDIKIRQLNLESIAHNDLQLLLVCRSMDSLLYFCHHARVDLDGDHLARLFKKTRREVSRSRTDFKDDIRRTDLCLLHDRVEDQWVLEHVLTVLLVHREGVDASGRGKARA